MRSSKYGTPQQRIRRALDAGASCFGQKGYFEATFDDVVRASGLSRGSLYWYFDSKDALYDAVLEHCATRLEAAFELGAEDLAGEGPVVARFLAGIAADVHMHEDAYRVLYLAPRPEAAADRLAQVTMVFVAHVRDVIAAARRRGEIASRPDDALADILHALAEGLVIRRLCDPTFDVARYVDTAAILMGASDER